MWMYMCIPQLTQWKLSRKSGNVHGCCHVRLLATPRSLACQAPLCMRLSRQEYWSGLPFPPPGGLPDPGIKPASPVSPALQVASSPAEPSGKAHFIVPFDHIAFLCPPPSSWHPPLYSLFLFLFLLKDNCFTEFSCFLSNLNMNQPWLYMYISVSLSAT